jgi:hypothetical protein
MKRINAEKRKLLLGLLDSGAHVLINLDARLNGVIVPKEFLHEYNLILRIGRELDIPNLRLTDDALTATLSFSRKRSYCVIPYEAIWAIRIEDTLWPDSIPPEFDARCRELEAEENQPS